MKSKWYVTFLGALIAVSHALGGGAATLKTGYYEAQVGAVVCGGCKSLIESTVKSVDGIGAAQVDPAKATVKFAVLKGRSVDLAKLQRALKKAADGMGMGADYALSDVKPLKRG